MSVLLSKVSDFRALDGFATEDSEEQSAPTSAITFREN